MQVHRLVEGICKSMVGWLSDCVWVGLCPWRDTWNSDWRGFVPPGLILGSPVSSFIKPGRKTSRS